MRIQILKKSLSSFWLGVFMKSPYFLILDDNKLGKDCLSFNRAYILIYICTWKLKINKCILFTTIYWENFFSHWIFVPFLDKVKKMCISKRAKWILIWVLMLLVKLVIHLHQLLLLVLLFFKYHEQSYQYHLLLQIPHILDSSFRTKLEFDHSRPAKDRWKVFSVRLKYDRILYRQVQMKANYTATLPLGTYWYFEQTITNSRRIEISLTRWSETLELYILIRSFGQVKT